MIQRICSTLKDPFYPMEFLQKNSGPVCRLGILAGSFHPVTRAHIALAEAAIERAVDEVLLVMPRVFPHKDYDGVGLEARVGLVQAAVAGRRGFSVAISEGGLFIDIARECRAHYGYDCEVWFLCGRDAAERIVNWDYGAEGRFAEQLAEFGLLVAERRGRFVPPEEFEDRIRALEWGADWNEVSATEIRERIRAGKDWAHLVPAAVVDQVRDTYSR